MVMLENHHKIISVVSILISLFFAIATGYLLYRYQTQYNFYWEEAKQKAIQKTNDAAKELIEFIDLLKPIATSIAQELTNKKMSEEEIEKLLKTKKIDAITGVGVAFLPNTYKPDAKLFGRAYIEKEGKGTAIKLEDMYDYTNKEYTWFNLSIKEDKPILEPHHNKELDTTVAQYTVPIYQKDSTGKKVVIGVAYANQSLEHLQHIIETLFLGKNGYWFILTEKGSFLAYPQLKYKEKTIFDIAKDQNNEELARVGKKIAEGQKEVFEYKNEITGAPSWLISEPIRGTSWSLVGVFDQGELEIDSNQFRRLLILSSITFILCILFFCIFILTFYTSYTLHKLSWLVLFLSLALVFQICWMWYAIYTYAYIPNEPNIYRVESRSTLYEYLKKNFPYSEEDQDPEYKTLSPKLRMLKMVPVKEYIPTGIYLNNLQFAEASEIKISAYFWQRFTKGLHDKVPRGFVFVQTNDANITEESKLVDRDGKDEIVTYDVFAKLNQFLTYTLYPFDTKSLRIKYWSKTSDETFYFVPDLNSYQLLNPRSLPGIDPDIYVPGWTILASYFGYQQLPYTTNFGAYKIGSFGVFSELDISAEPQPFFEIVVRRNLIDALVSDLIPLAVIAVLLFIVLLVSGPNKDNYVIVITSIFFATIFAQIRFRSKIPQAEIVYLESLYFILYIFMLVLLFICFLAQKDIKIKYFTTRNEMMLKLIYWPLLLSVFVVISLFYLW